ncbi:PRD domain-containing protein [Clostridiaceae bacterium DONG20-135]|uniref:PRD domain-containing protein n=1 Tax=Copranaerobaculum intestinale TaxID=2692629 RepID=A0A6N8UFY8_9FIRM|nr:PRD domain-containing protein [Copranaerobaculum intestinale]MXQ74187.1 PRD domain-containing protein [Copranaerobaculum intestinale]
MQVVKVFNNNAAAVVLEDGSEAIVTGKGVGFSKKPKDFVNLGRVQKVYTIEKNKRNRLYRLMETTPYEYIRVSEAILEKVKKELYPNINDLCLFSLVDHISFAIERVQKGIELPNLILRETRWLYPQEYDIAKWALQEIHQTSQVQLPDDEAGYIVLHILNASGTNKKDNLLDIMNCTKIITGIIEEEMKLEIDQNDFDYYRFVMHVKYLLSKLKTGQDQALANADELYAIFIEKDAKLRKSIDRINTLIQKEYGVSLSRQEIVYLAIHITKFIKR